MWQKYSKGCLADAIGPFALSPLPIATRQTTCSYQTNFLLYNAIRYAARLCSCVKRGDVRLEDRIVLVADDAAFMRKMMRMVLTEMGINNIIEATDGDAAIEKYRSEHPDLVLLDITMGRVNGLDALREIIEFDPKAKVIMCTAIGQQQTVMEALGLGAIDFVVKPFQKDKFITAIQRALEV